MGGGVGGGTVEECEVVGVGGEREGELWEELLGEEEDEWERDEES